MGGWGRNWIAGVHHHIVRSSSAGIVDKTHWSCRRLGNLRLDDALDGLGLDA